MLASSFRSFAAQLSYRTPGLREVHRTLYDRRFLRNREGNLFRGVFATREAAQAACPPDRRVGYDNDSSSTVYDSHLERVDHYDYPVLFWLQRSFEQGLCKVFDLGGHVGIKYYAFRRLLLWPESATWTVGDVPAVVRRGRALARERGEHALHFADEATAFDGCDVLLASGSLQYLPETLAELLARKASKPPRVLVNTTPIHEQRAFFTVNGIGTAYCPYRVQQRDTFIADLTAQGYTLADSWTNPGKRLDLPFEPGHTLTHYTGFCFERS